MSFDLSDTKDVQTATDASQESAGATKPLSPTGMRAMQGGGDLPGSPKPPDQAAADAPGLATIHPHLKPDSIETPPNIEVEGRTIKLLEDKPPAPPEGYHPGGPERG